MFPHIISSAEPFLYPGRKTGPACLLVHGFTGAPKEMHEMGKYLAEQGYTVMGIRLAGHASQPEDMLRMKWRDWLLSVEDGYRMLTCCSPQVFLMGLSMGAVLSLTFASQHPTSGVVAMSCPYELPPNPLLPLAGMLKPVMRYVDKGKPDWQNAEAARDHVEYPRFPVAGVVELSELMKMMRSRLPEVTSPVMIVQGCQDATVPVAHASALYDRIGSKDKHILQLEHSGHIVTREPDRQLLFQRTQAFIERLCSGAG
jgi:carboxylesterase